jgi:S-adenosylmethionine hydrolase
MSSLITLTTDFGAASPYAAVMKGVILSINPTASILDLSHSIRPQDLRHASYFLSTAVPYFPPGTLHVCVVDPGVGSERSAIYGEAGGQRFLGPDNGIFSPVLRKLGEPVRVRTLTDRRFWRDDVSHTFHGRDIFAPVAAHLSLGVDPEEFGPEAANWAELHSHSAVCWRNRCEGEIQFIDDFGNLITNIPAGLVKSLPVRASLGGGEAYPLRWVRTYSDAAAGDLVSLFSSDGFFEIAVVNGNAARRLNTAMGLSVGLEFE